MFVKRLLITILILGVVLEFSLRQFLGLGTAALSISHPTIEYMFAPNQDIKKFGNRFITNAWGMRSSQFPKRKLRSEELRILVFGDSIINGGNLTDHESIATNIVQRELSLELGQPVIVANVSAGSWGPSNWLAYSNEFGFFDADQIIIFMNGGDINDAPLFENLNPNTHPIQNPPLAIGELFTRYAPRYLPSWAPGGKHSSVEKTGMDLEDMDLAEAVARKDFDALVEQIRDTHAQIDVVRYAARDDVASGNESDRLAKVSDWCRELAIKSHGSLPYFRDESLDVLFRDAMHPNVAGQKALAKLLKTIIRENLSNLSPE